MAESDWHDPFAEDEAALERERRRAEREARRRGTQISVGEKVAAQQRPVAASPPSTPAHTGGAAPTAAAPPVSSGPPPRPVESPPAPPPATPPPSSGPTPPQGPLSSLRVRQLIGVLLLAAVAGVVIFAVSKVIDRIDGSDPKPAVIKQQPTSTIRIPEGYDRHQIAALAKKDGLKGDYLEATKKPPKHSGFDLAKYGAEGAPNLEGFLFPDTWDDLPKHATVHDLVDRQLADFQQRIKGVDMSYAESKNLTVYDVVNIASIIQREIAVPEEQKLAAAVIYNRLSANNPLGMDSTIRYYLQNYDEQLTESELAQDEPYNTRIYPGLPPTPISNPGLAAIEAAAHPAKSDAFYFVIKPGTCNEHVFVKTQAEFDKASAAYQQALQEQGGSPTDC
jgi:cell division protein YceG involved in septum cleavage